MSSHRAARGPAGTWRLTLATLALVAAGALMVGNQGTLAFWRDAVTVTGGQFTSGRLDLTVDNAQGAVATPYVKTNLALPTMLPGESVAEVLTLRNPGDAPYTWTAAVARGGDLGPALTVELYLGSATTGDDASYPRTEACATTTSPIVTTGATPTATRLATGTDGATGQAVCVRVSLPAATGNEYQSKTTGSVTLTFTATQVTP
ncbi:SipW-dependent-type signal peptide-containing protein [Nocardioides alkalitolerans]|uniref:SipW-dependent-type signal peptide-containing protein n=1 Tax=Nocardioides alkalitolerans TaxID=281714 RepID=UPI000411573F|nr:SipW-dependent-type signal peptide-containing protein [Nocardioides alkalitolerans]